MLHQLMRQVYQQMYQVATIGWAGLGWLDRAGLVHVPARGGVRAFQQRESPLIAGSAGSHLARRISV